MFVRLKSGLLPYLGYKRRLFLAVLVAVAFIFSILSSTSTWRKVLTEIKDTPAFTKHNYEKSTEKTERENLDSEPEHAELLKINLPEEPVPIIIEDILLSSSKPPPGRTIFFIENSCHRSYTHYKMSRIKAHQACPIESAALHNPNFQVFVLFACPTHRNKSMPIIDALQSYKNVHFRSLNLDRYAEDTPIADWVKKGDLYTSRYLIFHLSDLLRLITLYRFGGVYLDMDVLQLHSLEDEPLNYAGAETSDSIGNSVISLEPNGFGHQLGELFLQDFHVNYKGDAWAHNGPMGLVRVLSEICGTNNVTLMVNNRKRCLGFKVFDVNAFYEVPWTQWQLFFKPENSTETLARTKSSRMVHIWNHIVTKWPLKINSKSAYMHWAAQHCPRVVAVTGERFY
ncbi:lactosylceramide 4-alpha-galactosyltransferase-like isoform X2 [Drosophila novamexicana]|uniref:lactosylceramide 4-alpha-galactosyltransferase-like isoform X2 n=1 Tax=Drosophila novamexicana TaxID=47314 RepID=UPI0011E5E736|nr:lactosylceramide 4-alpha-galactosyltransferase-like isoform X2 [Drosophila novamexicana]